MIFFLNAYLDGYFLTNLRSLKDFPLNEFVRIRSCFSKISITSGILFFLLMQYLSYNTDASANQILTGLWVFPCIKKQLQKMVRNSLEFSFPSLGTFLFIKTCNFAFFLQYWTVK